MEVVKVVPKNYRLCNDAEYNEQRRCYHCEYYSFKSWSNEDINSGKCFLERPVAYVEGNGICDHFKREKEEDHDV